MQPQYRSHTSANWVSYTDEETQINSKSRESGPTRKPFSE